MKKIVRNAKGFTLVELMIVVAIIGILAAIAIPQFTQYRIRGFNSAAISDIRNLATAEAGLFTDVQSFGVTQPNVSTAAPAYAGNVAGAGAVCTGPPTATNNHAIAVTPDGATAASGMRVGVSNGVTVLANTDVINAGNPRASSYLLAAKHLNGNTYYGQDSDAEVIYQVQDDTPTAISRILTTADLPVPAVAGADDLNNQTLAAAGKAWAPR